MVLGQEEWRGLRGQTRAGGQSQGQDWPRHGRWPRLLGGGVGRGTGITVVALPAKAEDLELTCRELGATGGFGAEKMTCECEGGLGHCPSQRLYLTDREMEAPEGAWTSQVH